MKDDLRLRYTVPREMLLRAMRSWSGGRSRVDWGLGMMLVVLLAACAVIVPALALPFDAVVTLLVGLLAGVFLHWLRTLRARRKLTRLSLDAQDRAGPLTLNLGRDGVRTETALTLMSSRWAAVDRIIAMRDATVLLLGGTVLPIPDTALPRGLSPDAFRDRLEDWRTS